MRKKLKRLLAGILSVMLVMGMTEIPAKKVEAAGAPEFTARFTDADGNTITTAHPGDEVQVVLSVRNAGVMTAFKVSLLYDESKVQELGGSGFSKAFKNYYRDLDDEGFTVLQTANYDENSAGATFVYAADHKSKLPPAIEDGMDIAIIKLKVKEDLTGEVPVNIDYDSYAQGTGDMVNVDTKTLATTLNVKEQEIPATAIKLNKDTMSLDLSGTTTGKLTASYEPENTTDKGNTVTWESSEESVATVKDGNVTAVGKGTANITASIVNAEGKTLTSNVCKVTVSKSVKSVTLDQTEVGLKQGQKKTLKATVTPNDADDAAVTWKSSADDVVKVNQAGDIEAVAESGEATITASTNNGKSASCKVTVRTQHLENVTFGQDEISLARGKEEKLAVTYKPEKALITDELTEEDWKPSNTDVVTVDQEGNIKAVGKGNAEITYSVKAGGAEKKATIKVTVYVPVTDITITATPGGNLLKGTSKTLTAVLTPADADLDPSNLEWSISTANATLEANGNTCTVKGVSEGTAIVTVKDTVSGVTAELPITVTEKKITKVNVTAKKTTLNKGDETTATATVEPVDTTDDKTIKWTSSNEKVAKVDATGKITAVGGGKATIIATSTVREDVQGTVEITANVPLQSISIGDGDVELVKGQGTIFKIESYKPEDTTEDVINVKWESSDKTVATVDENGNVKALKAGETTITATVAGKEASRTVNVKEYPLKGIELAEAAKTVDKADGAFELTLLKNTEDGHDTTDRITSVEWTSSEESVATVTGDIKKATVTPVGAGTTKITVHVTTDAGTPGYDATCEVTVVIPLTGVEIYKDGTNVTGNTMRLVKDNSFILTASPVPADTTEDKTVTWESSDPTSVSVNDGVVTALKESREPVTITAKIGNKAAEIKVTAEEIHIESIILNKNYMKLDAKGLTAPKEEQLTVTYVPENTTDAKQIKTWSTSDSTVATVSADGTVTAVAAGTATITAVTENGKTVSCEVVVEKHIDSIELTVAKTTIKRKETVDLTTAINPEDATVDKTLEYSVDNADILDISKLATEGKVTGLKEGTATVTVTAVNAPRTPSAQIVLKVEEDHATADDFKFTDGEGTHEIRVDEKNPSIPLYYTEDAFTDDVVSVEYQVLEGSDVVDVDGAGNLTFKARTGRAKVQVAITVQNADGDSSVFMKEYSLELMEVPVEEITLDQNLSMTVGEDKTLTATFKPEDTTNKDLTWESSDPSIATVAAGEDGQAVVHALKAGTVTITAKTTEAQEGLTAQTTITVNDKPVIENPDKKPGQTTGQPGTGNKKPSNKNNQGNKKSVKTGDESPILPIAATGMVSLIVILAILILKRHRKAY